MELQKLIDQYLESINTYSDRTILRYKYLLGVFYDYIFRSNINSSTLITYLNGITPEDILNSLDYYIRSKGAASEDTINMYISVVREFFKYLKKMHYIENDNLMQSFGISKKDKNSFDFKFQSFVQKLLDSATIKPSTKGVPFSDEQVRLVVQYCNEHLDPSNPVRNTSADILYNQYVKALAIKLIAYLGVSLEVLNTIEMQHLDIEHGTIIVSGYRIHLPYRLRQQFELFIKQMLRNNVLDSPLFALYDGKAIFQPNQLGTFMNNKLKKESDIQNPSAITSLAKYAIIQLIDAGVGRDTIIELTGYKDEIFNSCIQIVDKVDMGIKSKQIDGALKQLPSFDYL